ncbi:hypothetical protein F511_43976 [Dorcoceras hygrometricum]|uniref:Uncharacterized protein n=1 Tax=Dorcoceras hygrometricum TaxID=472368 RepID=A0A2Z7AGT3_9LAMI|nr:hypothetical protein F511_43976 [Dorcoceras hygrometricum]
MAAPPPPRAYARAMPARWPRMAASSGRLLGVAPCMEAEKLAERSLLVGREVRASCCATARRIASHPDALGAASVRSCVARCALAPAAGRDFRQPIATCFDF